MDTIKTPKSVDSTQTIITMIGCEPILKAHSRVTTIMNVVNIGILLYACVNTALMIISMNNEKSISDIYFKAYSCLINVLVFAWNVIIIKLIKPINIYKAKIESSPQNSIYSTMRTTQSSTSSNGNLVHSVSLAALESEILHEGVSVETSPRPKSTPA